MSDKLLKELANSYKTSEHFKDRLRERFNVYKDQLIWAQTFFNQSPRLISEKDNVQKWSNGNIVVVVNVVERAYITAWTNGSSIYMDNETYQKFSKLADEIVLQQLRQSIKNIAALKKQIVTTVSQPELVIEDLEKASQNMAQELEALDKKIGSVNQLLEIITVTDDIKKEEDR